MHRTPLLIGILLSAAVLASWLIAPRLRSTDRIAADAALEQSELAQRKLFRYSPLSGYLEQLTDPAAVLGGELEQYAAQAEGAIQDLNARLAQDVAKLNQQAAEAGLTALRVALPTATDSGLRPALQAYSTVHRENQALLDAALAEARAAANESPQTPGVQQVLGMVESARAARLLGEAGLLRNELAERRARLLVSAARWKEEQGQADYFSGLEVTEVIAGLQRDLVELEELRTDGVRRLAELTALEQEREAAVARTEAGLREARSQLLALEERGFTAGNDASFSAYRDQYLRLSDQLRILEEEELELRFGVRRGATLDGDDLGSAEIVGGQPTEGLDKLRARLEIAAERTRRLDSAQESLQSTIAAWSNATESARAEAQRFRGLMERRLAEQQALIEEITRLATEAFELEKAAVAAAQASVRAFASSQSALDSWVSAAQEAQQQDASGKNERLRLITSDAYYRWFGVSAEGASRLLEARGQAQIIEGNQAIIDDMRLYSSLNLDFSFDDSAFQTAIVTARDAAFDTLEKARVIFAEKLSRGPEVSRWVPQAALASVHQMLGRLDPERAEEQKQKAIETLGQALARREQSPYLREHARFRDFLTGGLPPPASTPPPDGAGADDSENPLEGGG